MSLKHLPQLELFNSPLVNKALNKLTGSKLRENRPISTPKTNGHMTNKEQSKAVDLPPIEATKPTKKNPTITGSKFDPEKIYPKLIKGLRHYFDQSNCRRSIVGLSGGLDSTVTFKLAVDALGKDRVIAIIMPEIGITKAENIKHAKGLAQYFEVKTYYQPINPFLLDFRSLAWKPSPLAEMNTKARIRMVIMYNYANSYQSLVLGTSNKSELLLGYGTKYGDLAADIEVIAELYKTEVYELGRYLDIPEEILLKTPSAELAPGQTDENELGASYEVLDAILKNYELGTELPGKFDATLVEKVLHRITCNVHKRLLPPAIKID